MPIYIDALQPGTQTRVLKPRIYYTDLYYRKGIREGWSLEKGTVSADCNTTVLHV